MEKLKKNEKKRNVKIIYQYDGSKFYGFQRQKNKKTVQGEIEKIIFKNFAQKINMISSGRTDKGVHALEQVSNFFIDKKIPLEAVKRQINKNMYGEIKVLSVEETDGMKYILKCALNSSYEVLKIVGSITSMDEVKWCEPEMLMDYKPSNPLYPQQYYLKNTGQDGHSHTTSG